MVSRKRHRLSFGYMVNTRFKAKIHYGWDVSDASLQLQGPRFNPEFMLVLYDALRYLGFSRMSIFHPSFWVLMLWGFFFSIMSPNVTSIRIEKVPHRQIRVFRKSPINPSRCLINSWDSPLPKKCSKSAWASIICPALRVQPQPQSVVMADAGSTANSSL